MLEDKRVEVEFMFSGEQGGQMEADWQQLISATEDWARQLDLAEAGVRQLDTALTSLDLQVCRVGRE